jgi:iron complex outermembrane receptor protein
MAENPDRPIYQINPVGISQPGYWVFNGRISLRDLDIGGVSTELALWGRNLSNEKARSFQLNLNDIFLSANYIPARTYGLDLTVQF